MYLQKRALSWVIVVVFLVSLFAIPVPALASGSRVNTDLPIYPMATAPSLGVADSFSVLGGSTVTNTGPTVVSGDLGVSPGNSVTGFPPGIVNGTMHVADAVAGNAQNDVTTAYNSLAGQPCNTNLTGQDLGGLTLTPGVYCFSSSAQLTGILTLNMLGNANSVFIFQIGSSLTTASNSSVMLINGGSPCNVYWQVGSSATLGTTTSFLGNILALTSITLNTGATITGRALAQNGAVTLDSNTITTGQCASTPPSTVGVIRIFKFNDLNGNGVYEPGLGDSPIAGQQFLTTGPGTNDTSVTDALGFIVLPGLAPGAYIVTETSVPAGWTLTTANPQSGSVSAGGVTILSFGNRLQQASPLGHIRVFKYNDSNHSGNFDTGEAPLGGFQFCINNVCKLTDATGYTAYWDVLPGTYIVCETARQGWFNSDPQGSCEQLTVAGDQVITWSFGNYAVSGPPTGTVVGGEIASDGLSGLLFPLFGMAALIIGGGILIGLRRRHNR